VQISNWSKKMAAFALTLICATVLAWRGTVTGMQWMEFARWVTGVYIVGQAAVDVAGKLKGT
jgi:hypothetical protein